MRLPFTSARLPSSVLDSLAAHLGRRPKVLAWARTADGHAVGLTGRLMVQDTGGWTQWPWHRIVAGHWDQEYSRLSWTDAEGRVHEAVLDGGLDLAELFNERVSASVVFSRRVELGRGRHLTIALRRNLEPGEDATEWRVTPSAGLDLTEPAVSARLDQELAAARADFGID